MNTLKKITIVFLILVTIFVLVLVLLSRIPTEEQRSITRSYPVSEGKILLIDTWDCGATCPFQAKIILQTISEESLEEKVLLSCNHISDIELAEITENSTRIERMVGNSSECEYQLGEVISF